MTLRMTIEQATAHLDGSLGAITQAKRLIASRAGCRAGDVPVYFAHYDDYPPTLQRVGARGKILKQRRGERARGNRRVVVGKGWLQKNAPEIWAMLIAARILHGPDAIFPSTVPPVRY